MDNTLAHAPLRWLTIVFWLIVASAVGLVGFMGISWETLRSQVAQKNAELAQAQQQLDATRKELGDINEQMRERQAQRLVANDTFIANQDIFAPLIKECTAAGAATPFLQNCAHFDVFWMWFMNAYTKAASFRSNSDFKDALAYYKDVIPLFRPTTAPKEWQARVYEGIAYSEYKLKNISQAEADIQTALGLDPESAFVRATGLKLACSKGAPAAQISNILTDARNALDAKVAQENAPNVTNQDVKRDAKLEQGYLEHDPELFATCGYAGIQPRAIVGYTGP